MSRWVRVQDGNYPLEVKCWALWDDGEVEIASCLSGTRNGFIFQRKCGTDEGHMGWDNNVGYVVAWHPLDKPELPKELKDDCN